MKTKNKSSIFPSFYVFFFSCLSFFLGRGVVFIFFFFGRGWRLPSHPFLSSPPPLFPPLLLHFFPSHFPTPSRFLAASFYLLPIFFITTYPSPFSLFSVSLPSPSLPTPRFPSFPLLLSPTTLSYSLLLLSFLHSSEEGKKEREVLPVAVAVSYPSSIEIPSPTFSLLFYRQKQLGGEKKKKEKRAIRESDLQNMSFFLGGGGNEEDGKITYSRIDTTHIEFSYNKTKVNPCASSCSSYTPNPEIRFSSQKTNATRFPRPTARPFSSLNIQPDAYSLLFKAAASLLLNNVALSG